MGHQSDMFGVHQQVHLQYLTFRLFSGTYVTKLERIYNPITEMGFSAMFTFQLDNTKS